MSLGKKIKNFISEKRFWKNIAYLVLAYIAIVGGTILYLNWSTNHGEKIEVPNVVGKSVKSVETVFEDLGLQYEILDSIYMPNKPAGTIIEQDPMPTAQTTVFVKSERIIRLRVSKKIELVEMPGLVDKSIRFAEQVLKNRGIEYQIIYVQSSEAQGAILEQKFKGKNIKEGTKIPKGAKITLVVGKNDSGEPVQIPDLMGKTISDVRLMLSTFDNIKLRVICPNCENSDDTLRSVVFSQSPEYIDGQMTSGGSTVVVSSRADKDLVPEPNPEPNEGTVPPPLPR